ncbi:ribosomal protein L28e [Hesseltinella vesiculosa]|uniref:Ribosomal protein L28e n=1 Tax=Hesseltinella vesiculosa TaxID=101127 RepID=A0A1X2GDP0_9FUNG|nr:ribosomal protein L28e [Hesseltinella vesiculosa]
MSSSDLIWALIKNNNSYLVKRNGAWFSTEPTNLTNLHSKKFSGLANTKAVGIADATRGVKVSLKSQKAASPAKVNTTVITKPRRHTAKSVANLVARSKYRPDLLPYAQARASAIISSQQPKKERAPRQKKANRA